MQGGQPNLFARPPQFSEDADQPILRSELDETPSDWRGNVLLFHAPASDTGYDVWALDTTTGKEHWRSRLGGNHSASPIHADGRVYFLNEDGESVVIHPGTTFQALAVVLSPCSGYSIGWRRPALTTSIRIEPPVRLRSIAA